MSSRKHNPIVQKFYTAIYIIRIFRNWPRIFLTIFGPNFLKKRRFCLRNGVQFDLDSSKDWPTILEIWLNKAYNRFGLEFNDNTIVVDIGANVGVFSVFAVFQSNNIKVYSYEPFPGNFMLLKNNIKLNNLKNIEPFQLAVAANNKKRKLFLDETSIGHSLVETQGKFIEVNCVTLPEILAQINKCDFLKMDCEGAEYEIILNTPVTYLKKINQISMELHRQPKYTKGKDISDVIDKLIAYLESSGFNVVFDESDLSYIYAKRKS